MRREDKRFWPEWYQAFPELNIILISSWMPFRFVSVVPKYLNFATFSNYSLAVLIFWFCPEFWWRDMIIYFTCCSSCLVEIYSGSLECVVILKLRKK
jgi:hypothetical protein